MRALQRIMLLKVREKGHGKVMKEFSGSKAGKISLTKVHKKRTRHEELHGAQEANDSRQRRAGEGRCALALYLHEELLLQAL